MVGIWEILVILFVLLAVVALVVGVILLVVWLVRRGQKPTSTPTPVQSPSSPGPQPTVCPRCGAALPADTPQGLCPRCVLSVGLATHTEATGESGPHGTKVLKPAPALEDIAKRFPQLEILECLGRGGMGVVYRARQPKLNRLVALKILAPEKGADPKFAERFAREAQALARLNHPNIVTVHDFGEADGMFYVLMEYVDGVTLRQLLREGRMKPEEALAIVPPICEALQYAHERGVVHRDIKPENVLLDKEGRVKIADFGIAKIMEGRDASPRRPGGDERPAGPAGPANLTGAQDVMGTPHYMAPEQVEKPQLVDHRADIYSLGVVFYEMLTGELPLGKFQPPSRKVQIDVRLDEVVLRALEKEPERRYQHASVLKTDVETIAQTGKSEIANRKSEIPPRFSRAAVVGACWAPFVLALLVALYPAARVSVEPGQPVPGPALRQMVLMFPLLLLGLSAPFGTTILGWTAVSQIRHSAGRLYGLGLAVFDGLLFPLLALDGLLYLFWGWVGDAAGQVMVWELDLTPSGVRSLILLLTLLTCAGLNLVIVRKVWRAVNTPLAEAGSPTGVPPVAAPVRSSGRGWKIAAITVGAGMLILAILVGSSLLWYAASRPSYRVALTQKSADTPPAAPSIEQAVKAIEDYGGFVKRDPFGRIYQVNLVYDEDAQGNRRECNNTSDRIAAILPALVDLEELMLRGLQASDFAMQYVGQIKSLKRLYMWDAAVSDDGVAKLAELDRLEYLHISNAGIGDASLEVISRLPRITGLALQGNHFTDKGLKHLGRMTQLKELWIGLGHGKITDEGLRHLANLTNLEELELQECDITDRGLEYLHGLKRLKTIWISHRTKVTEAGKSKLKQELPGLEIK